MMAGRMTMSEKLLYQLPEPCPFCGADGIVKKTGNPLFYWTVDCSICQARVAGTSLEKALNGWNRRPLYPWVPLRAGEPSYLLPSGQKFQHLLIWEDGNISLFDYIEDGKVAAQVDVALGEFRIAGRRRVGDLSGLEGQSREEYPETE
jgi:hypothetical protein